MLFIFKKKPFLRDLIPDNHIDIHSHILPGIDDGARTAEDSLELIANLKAIGFSEFIATPHIMKNVWENDVTTITKSLNIIKNDTLKIHAAAEYLLDANFAELFETEKLMTLRDNHVLVEMSYINPPIQLYQIIFDLQVAGYIPVLAHPERYSFYHRDFEELRKLKNAGCLFQVNLLSSIGYYGGSAAQTAQKLLTSGMIDFSGSDVHHAKHIKGFSSRVILKDILPLKESIANNEFFRM